MTLPQRELPEAVAEFDAAVHWYEAQEPGAGLALIDRAESARKDIGLAARCNTPHLR